MARCDARKRNMRGRIRRCVRLIGHYGSHQAVTKMTTGESGVFYWENNKSDVYRRPDKGEKK